MENSWQQAIAWVLTEHREFHRLLGEALANADTTHANYLGIAALAFGLGLLHALTPGHGKIVLFSYFLGHQAKPLAGMIAAAQLSAVHVTTGVMLVTVVGASTQAFGRPSGAGLTLQLISAVLVTVSGLWLLWKAIHGTGEHGQHTSNSALPLALGMLPCPLTMLLMTSATINASYWVGLSTVAVMATGIMATIGIVGTVAILARRSILCAEFAPNPALSSVLRWLEITSSVVVILIGLFYASAI